MEKSGGAVSPPLGRMDMAFYENTFSLRTYMTLSSDALDTWESCIVERDWLSVYVCDDGSIDIERFGEDLGTIPAKRVERVVALYHEGWTIGAIAHEGCWQSYGMPRACDVTLLGWSDRASKKQKAAYAEKCGTGYTSKAAQDEIRERLAAKKKPKPEKPPKDPEKTAAFKIGSMIGKLLGK